MTQPILKQRLSTLDATFLYYERKEAPFHVGSTMILDGEISAEDFKVMLSSKLPLLPRYLQKVVPPPFNIGYPSWELDPDFNIKNHIFQVQLDPPGTLEQLRILTGQIQTKMLDRNKPLWELYVINGLQGKRAAIISKVHHTMIDGVAGVELMNISFDHSPDMPPRHQSPTLSPPPTPPARRANDVAGRWLNSLVDSAMDITDNWNQLQRGLLSLGGETLKQYGDLIARPSKNPLVTLATPVSLLPFNKPNSGTLDINWRKFSFAEAHSIEERLGGTVNDVMLCAVSGAVIRYMQHHGFETEKATLRFFVPVNARHDEDGVLMGNKISALPVEVPLRLHNSLERYHYVVKETTEMKKARVADQFSLLVNAIGVIPPPVQALVGSLMYTTVPLVNMVCTNVPGPHFPLYILGKKLTDNYSYVPFAYAVGLTCVIFSYNHQLFISLSSDGAKMPGLGKEFMVYLAQTFAELRDYAGILSTEIPVVEPLPEVPEDISETPAPEVLAPEVLAPETLAPETLAPETRQTKVPAAKPATKRKPAAKKAKVKKVAEEIKPTLVKEETLSQKVEVLTEKKANESPEMKAESELPALAVPVMEMVTQEPLVNEPQPEPLAGEPVTGAPKVETAGEIPESEKLPVETVAANLETDMPPGERLPEAFEAPVLAVEAVSEGQESTVTPAPPVAEEPEVNLAPSETELEDPDIKLIIVKPVKSGKKKAEAQPQLPPVDDKVFTSST